MSYRRSSHPPWSFDGYGCSDLTPSDWVGSWQQTPGASDSDTSGRLRIPVVQDMADRGAGSDVVLAGRQLLGSGCGEVAADVADLVAQSECSVIAREHRIA